MTQTMQELTAAKSHLEWYCKEYKRTDYKCLVAPRIRECVRFINECVELIRKKEK